MTRLSKISLSVLSLLLLGAAAAFAQTNVSGNITPNSTWTPAGNPYNVTGNANLLSGTLTIQPDVQVVFTGLYAININGTLIAQGTSSQKITFASSSGTRGSWNWLNFNATSTGNILRHVKIFDAKTAVLMTSVSSLTIEDCEIRNVDTGISMSGASTPTIRNNIISTGTNTGILVQQGSAPVTISGNTIDGFNIGIIFREGVPINATNNTISNMRSNGINIDVTLANPGTNSIIKQNIFSNNTSNHVGLFSILSEDLSHVVFDLQQNQWDNSSDPVAIAAKIQGYNKSVNAPFPDFSKPLVNGQPVNVNVFGGTIKGNRTVTKAAGPIYTVITNVNVRGGNLTIDAGVTLQFLAKKFFGLDVFSDGTLRVNGTAAEPVTFSSNAAVPTQQDWRGISIVKKSEPISKLSYAVVRDAYTGLLSKGGTASVDNSTFTQNENGIQLLEGTQGTLTNLTVTNNKFSALTMSGASPVIDNGTFSNTTNGSGIFIKNNSSPTIKNSRVNNNSISGLEIVSGSKGQYLNNEVKDNIFAAFKIQDAFFGKLTAPNSFTIDNNQILNNQTGFTIDNSSVTVSKNTIASRGETMVVTNKAYVVIFQNQINSFTSNGIRAGDAGTFVKVSGNTFIGPNNGTGTAVNIQNSAAAGSIDVNIIDKSATGVLIDTGATIGQIIGNTITNSGFNGIKIISGGDGWPIQKNIITNNNVGIFLDPNQSPLIDGNTINANVTGITLNLVPTQTATPVITNNSLAGNTSWGFVFGTSTQDLSRFTINARNNWWGSTDPYVIGTGIVGWTNNNRLLPTVDWSGFLTSQGGPSSGQEVASGPNLTTLTKANGPILGVGDIVVRDNNTLTIQEGVILKFLAGKYWGLINESGTITAAGTQTEPIQIISSGAAPTERDWRGVVFESGASSSSVLDYVQVRHSFFGLDITTASPQFKNGLVEQTETAIKIQGGSSALIQGTTIQNNKFSGVQIEANNTPTIDNCTIISNNDGISITNASPVITATKINNNRVRGINALGWGGRIDQGEIKNNTFEGIALDSSLTSLVINGVTLQGNQTGIAARSNSKGTIQGNTIKSHSGTGVLLETGSNPTITGNTIENNLGLSGIMIHSSATQVLKPLINQNTIQNNTPFELHVDTLSGNLSSSQYDIDAMQNYWGTTNIRTIEQKIYHNPDPSNTNSQWVNFSNYLGSAGGSPIINQIVWQPITANTTWEAAKSPYIVVRDIPISTGVTLTIEPGVQVQFDGNYSLTNNGTMSAQGTKASPIVFTRTPLFTTQWKQLEFGPTSQGNILKYLKVEYAQTGVQVDGLQNFAVSNSQFLNNTTGIFYTLLGKGSLSYNTFSQNTTAVKFDAGSSAALLGNTITSNSTGIDYTINATASLPAINFNILANTTWNILINTSGNVSRLNLDAKNNYWGTIDPVAISSKISDYADSSAKAAVIFSRYLDSSGIILPIDTYLGFISAPTTFAPTSWHLLVGNLTADSGVTLTVSPGSLVYVYDNAQLTVNGTLNAPGTAAQRIKFNAIRSLLGGAVPGLWGPIQFTSTSRSNNISYVDILYAKNAVIADGTGNSLTVNQSTIKNSSLAAVQFTNGAGGSVTNSTITNNLEGVKLTGASTSFPNVTINNNDISQNTSWNVYAASTSGNASRTTINATQNWLGFTTPEQIATKLYDLSNNANNPVLDYSDFLNAPLPTGQPTQAKVRKGYVAANTTWRTTENLFYLVGNLAIDPNVTLTIEPGVRILFANNGTYSLTNNGTLNAQGTSANHVTFSTNRSTPAPGSWGSLQFTSTSRLNNLNFTDISYGTNAVVVDGASNQLTMNQSKIENSSAVGIQYTNGAGGAITGSTIRNNQEGVRLSGVSTSFPNVTINNNDISQNTNWNIYAASTSGNASRTTINATQNWLGFATISQIAQKIYDYSNNASYPVVDYSNFLNALPPTGQPTPGKIKKGYVAANTTWRKADNPFYILSNVTIDPTVTLTIEPGVDVFFQGNYSLSVDGTLLANGTNTDRIIFTMDPSLPQTINSWNTIDLKSSGASSIQYADIKFARDGVTVNNASPTLKNNVFQQNGRGIVMTNGASVVTGNIFVQNGYGFYFLPSLISSVQPLVNNNQFLDDTAYDFYADGSQNFSALPPINAENNWWNTTDPLVIAQKIYDNADNGNSQVVDFTPFDLGGNVLTLTNVSAAPQFFSPILGEQTQINYTLNQPANRVTVKILDETTKALIKALIKNQPRAAGSNLEVWDGKNTSGQFVAEDTNVIYTIEARDDITNLFALYDPIFVAGSVQITNGVVTPATFDPYKGETATVSYGLVSPAKVLLQVGLGGFPSPSKTLINYETRKVTGNTEIWDGRDNSGNIVAASSYVVAGWTQLLPVNNIHVEGNRNFAISSVTANPYAIYPKYKQVTDIQYTITANAVVSVVIYDPSRNLIRNLVSNLQQNAGTYKIQWDGRDNIGKVVNTSGSYNVRVTAIDTLSSTTLIQDGNITVFK